jgi:hypothetical protein
MKRLKRLALNELRQGNCVLSSAEQESIIGGGTVKIVTNRQGYGDDSTLSVFTAYAYDDNGNIVSSMSGYFLEPGWDESKCYTSRSDTAIAPGVYNVIPCTFHGASGYFEISGVKGRSGIIIHAGNTGDDTMGCFLPGSSYGYNSQADEYYITGGTSRPELKNITNFLNSYGSEGITINVGY